MLQPSPSTFTSTLVGEMHTLDHCFKMHEIRVQFLNEFLQSDSSEMGSPTSRRPSNDVSISIPSEPKQSQTSPRVAVLCLNLTERCLYVLKILFHAIFPAARLPCSCSSVPLLYLVSIFYMVTFRYTTCMKKH